MSNLEVLEELTSSLVNTSPESQLYKDALDLLPIGVAIISSRIVTWGNIKCLTLFGYSSVSEIIGKNTCDFYSSRSEYERSGKACYPRGETLARMKRKDGDESMMHIRVVTSNETGRALVTFCSLDSIRKLCDKFGGTCK
jgi:hypothetical protein